MQAKNGPSVRFKVLSLTSIAVLTRNLINYPANNSQNNNRVSGDSETLAISMREQYYA